MIDGIDVVVDREAVVVSARTPLRVISSAAVGGGMGTATESKTLALITAGVRSPEGAPASGTSTDAVVVAASGRGPRHRFGGPVSDLGWVVGRVVRFALDEGIRRWKADNG